jgi:putative SOS response-associated peptidase YedK
MIVSAPSAWMEAYHGRMPILLRPGQSDSWLSGEMGADELQPAAEEALRKWPVSKLMNRTGHGDEDPTIIQPI